MEDGPYCVLTWIHQAMLICLLSEHMTVIRQRIDTPVPRKRVGSASVHEKVNVPTTSRLGWPRMRAANESCE